MTLDAHPLAGVSCLVLGAGGFIGSHLCQALHRAGARVHGFGRPPAFPGSLPPIRFTEGEFTDRAALALAVDGAEIVFHLLGNTNPELSNKNPIADLEVNTLPSVHLLGLCRATRVRKIVFVSSGGTVYGMPAVIPIREDAATNPISAYGISKLMIEKYLQLFARLDGPSAVILRVANPFGPFQSPFRGQGLVAALIEAIIAKRPLEIWGDGSVVRDYFYISDLSEAIICASLYEGKELVFNIGSGIGLSVSKVIDTICQTLGCCAPETSFNINRQADVPINVLDITLAKYELGWSPRTTWSEGLCLTASWMRNTFFSIENVTALAGKLG